MTGVCPDRNVKVWADVFDVRHCCRTRWGDHEMIFEKFSMRHFWARIRILRQIWRIIDVLRIELGKSRLHFANENGNGRVACVSPNLHFTPNLYATYRTHTRLSLFHKVEKGIFVFLDSPVGKNVWGIRWCFQISIWTSLSGEAMYHTFFKPRISAWNCSQLYSTPLSLTWTSIRTTIFHPKKCVEKKLKVFSRCSPHGFCLLMSFSYLPEVKTVKLYNFPLKESSKFGISRASLV